MACEKLLEVLYRSHGEVELKRQVGGKIGNGTVASPEPALTAAYPGREWVGLVMPGTVKGRRTEIAGGGRRESGGAVNQRAVAAAGGEGVGAGRSLDQTNWGVRKPDECQVWGGSTAAVVDYAGRAFAMHAR